MRRIQTRVTTRYSWSQHALMIYVSVWSQAENKFQTTVIYGDIGKYTGTYKDYDFIKLTLQECKSKCKASLCNLQPY